MNRKFCILNCDESDSNKVINFIQEFPEFYCVGISDTYDQSVNLVLKTLPDIVFIDIDNNQDSPEETAFALVKELFQYLDYFPTLIAISSSTEKAYDLIKIGCYDYLLKPLSELDVRRCFLRLKKNFKNHAPQKICLKSYSDYRFIDLDEILYLQADNNTTDFFLTDNRIIAGFKPLKVYEMILPQHFLRIHNSYIVNTHFVVRINFAKSNLTLTGENKIIPFSRSHKKEVEMLKKSLYSLNAVQA